MMRRRLRIMWFIYIYTNVIFKSKRNKNNRLVASWCVFLKVFLLTEVHPRTNLDFSGLLLVFVEIMTDKVIKCHIWSLLKIFIFCDFFTYGTYVKFRDTRNMSVWTKISYWMFYQTPIKYIYLDSARRYLQNGVKNLIKIILLCKKIGIKTKKKIQFLLNLRKDNFFNLDFYTIL